jgi:hypothetical protein
MNTLEKINKGTIRIENGKLIGLGNGNVENAIDVATLDELLEYCDKQDIVEGLTNTITGISRIYAVLSKKTDDQIAEFCDNWIRTPVPNDSDIYSLGLVLKLFNK